jgi:hypothetical protein
MRFRPVPCLPCVPWATGLSLVSLLGHFRVFGVFRGLACLDFPGWACRLDFCAERAVPSGARRIGGVSGSFWLEWFTRRRGDLAGLVPASSAAPRATLLSFHGTATRWPRSYGRAGVTTRFRPVPCVPWATELSLISLPGAFVYLVCFVVLPVWTFRAGLAAWISELKERRRPVPAGSTEYPVRRGQTGSRGGAESAEVGLAGSPRLRGKTARGEPGTPRRMIAFPGIV